MLWTVSAIVWVLWLVGLGSSHRMGGFFHVLVVMALILFVVLLVSA
jgi:uncharacterized protein DUF5670